MYSKSMRSFCGENVQQTTRRCSFSELAPSSCRRSPIMTIKKPNEHSVARLPDPSRGNPDEENFEARAEKGLPPGGRYPRLFLHYASARSGIAVRTEVKYSVPAIRACKIGPLMYELCDCGCRVGRGGCFSEYLRRF